MTRSWLSFFIYARHMHFLMLQDRDSRIRCQQQQQHNGYSLFRHFPIIYDYTNDMLLQVKEYTNEKYFKRWQPLVKMYDPMIVKAKDAEKSDVDAQAKADKKAKEKGRNSFKEKTIRSYENRLRRYSSPEKLFRYFATIKMKNEHGRWEIYMTPLDFLRSLMPDRLQPENLGLDHYHKIDSSRKLTYPGLDANSVFWKFQVNGLLTYSDYFFMRWLISMPERYIEIAFRLFDYNGDGNLSRDELRKMLESLGFDDSYLRNLQIQRYFFGNNLKQKLSISKFLQFQRLLNEDILLLEFNLLLKNRPVVAKDEKTRKQQNKNAKITELAFAKVLLAYAPHSEKERLKTLKRIKEKYSESTQGISLHDFMSFFAFVRDIGAIDTALTFHFLTGADISRKTLKHISKVVVGVHLSDHLIDIIYTVFDTDENGILSRKELVNAFRERKNRGKDHGYGSAGMSLKLCAIGKCFQETIRSYI